MAKKIAFHRELADLGMQVVDLRLMVAAGALGTIAKRSAQAVHRLPLPGTHLGLMKLVF